MDLNTSKFGIGRITGWNIKNFIENKDQLKMAKAEWKLQTQDRPILQNLCRKEDLDQEVEWIESTLTEILNKNCKLVRVTPYSKRWWNKEVETARRSLAKEKRTWEKITLDKEKFKQARNAFYRIVRKAKRECWQNFLEGEEEISDPSKNQPEDKNRCWIALKYTKPQTNSTTPALKGPNNKIAVTMQAKEALVKAHAFPKPYISQGAEYQLQKGDAHLLVTKDTVHKALFCQSVKKAPVSNLHNFLILRLLWDWVADRITSLATQTLRLQYHPQEWKHARGVLIEKSNKRDHTLVKFYRVISLLNCLDKVVEKLVAEQLSLFCEKYRKLHKRKMKARKHRSATDAAAILIQQVHEI